MNQKKLKSKLTISNLILLLILISLLPVIGYAVYQHHITSTKLKEEQINISSKSNLLQITDQDFATKTQTLIPNTSTFLLTSDTLKHIINYNVQKHESLQNEAKLKIDLPTITINEELDPSLKEKLTKFIQNSVIINHYYDNKIYNDNQKPILEKNITSFQTVIELDGKKFEELEKNLNPDGKTLLNQLGRARGSDINGLTNRNSQDKAVNRMLGSTKEMR